MFVYRLQEMLLGFQADLGGISSEIRHLQEESVTLDIKLRNRRGVEKRLNDFLKQVLLLKYHVNIVNMIL